MSNVCLLLYYILKQLFSRVQRTFVLFIVVSTIITIQVGRSEHGCQDKYEIAEYLEVTEEYLEDCIECYRNKYGICKRVDNYVVYFIPQLSVMKLV